MAGADVIACEDTRVTRQLTEHYGIATPLTPYHEHNAAEARPKLLKRLAEGQAVALVSDAGTPLISDPGYRLVREASEAGHRRHRRCRAHPRCWPRCRLRACRPTVSSSRASCRPRQVARQKRIAELARIPATLVLFESGPRLAGALADLAAALGPRAAAVCRELTKLHEEIRRGDLAALARDYAQGAETRGEIVIVVAPPAEVEQQRRGRRRTAAAALARVSVKDAVGEVALATGRPRREVYRRALELAKDGRRWRAMTA